MNTPKETTAAFALTAPLTIAPPPLNDGEIWAGIVTTPEGLHHVILLPGDHDAASWKKQLGWAKKAGGDLPDRQELALLHVMLPDEFKKEWYWSCKQHAANSDYAWYQYFDSGYQYYYYVNSELRARAVRRVAI
jgi:hypothetical protein